jgi:hypothetical protein
VGATSSNLQAYFKQQTIEALVGGGYVHIRTAVHKAQSTPWTYTKSKLITCTLDATLTQSEESHARLTAARLLFPVEALDYWITLMAFIASVKQN